MYPNSENALENPPSNRITTFLNIIISIFFQSKSTPQESTGEMGKATRTLLFIIISFFVAWIPSSIVAVIFTINPILLHQGFFTSIWYIFVAWLTYANSFLNPIAYSVSQPLFRKTVFKILFHPLSVCRK